MIRPSFLHSLLIVGHGVLAAVVILNLYQQRELRHDEVGQLRELAQTEEALTESHRNQVAIYEALLEGVREKDPYVIELLARDRLGYRQRETREVPPPRLDP